MQLGDFGLKLSPETPLSVRELVRLNDTVMVTPARIPHAEVMSADNLKDAARWRGVVQEVSADRTEIRGAGMLYYLGNANGDGGYNPPYQSGAKDWSEHLTVINATNDAMGGLTVATVVDEPAATYPTTTDTTIDVLPPTTLERLLFLAGVLGCEFYVTPDDRFVSGGAGSDELWRTGQVVLMRDHQGRDIDTIGLRIESWVVTEDAHDVVEYGWAVSTSNGTAWLTGSAVASVYWFRADGTQGGVGGYYSRVDVKNDAGYGLAARAQAIADEAIGRQRVDVSVRTIDPGRWMRPGDYLYAYDPIDGIHDAGNFVTYHGMHFNPASLRLFGMTWGVTPGMGVYRLGRDHGGAFVDDPLIVDLTDWVQFEDDVVQLEVGAPGRSYDD